MTKAELLVCLGLLIASERLLCADAAAEALERDTHCRHLLKIIRRVPPKEPAPQAKPYTAPVPMIVHRKAPVPQAKAYTAPAPAPELKATQPGRLLLNSNIIGRPRHTSSLPQAKAYTAPVPMIVHRKAPVPQAKAYTAPAPAPELKATQPGRRLLQEIRRVREPAPQAKVYTAPVKVPEIKKAPVP
ncbi:hypothetical protein OEZ86_002991 [Tetradesmus obliquus]|nr:hypothetical protein OEZ86_002991 [Tetradesmus obliquus]